MSETTCYVSSVTILSMSVIHQAYVNNKQSLITRNATEHRSHC